MSKEYIEREALINLIEENSETKFDWSECVDIDILRPAILDMPAADVEPVRHGKWIEIPFKPEHEWDTVKGYATYKCSECGRHEYKKEPYCNCGAKMDGGNR